MAARKSRWRNDGLPTAAAHPDARVDGWEDHPKEAGGSVVRGTSASQRGRVDDGSNDAAWFQTTLERLEGPLVRFALPIAGDLESARDVVQDAFLRLLEQPRAKVEPHVASWLFTVVRRRALDVRKKEGRMRPHDDTTPELRDAGPGSAAVAEANDLHAQLLQLVGGLPASQQEVVRLRFQGGLSYREIADVTGHSEGNVGFLLHVAIKALRARAQAPAVSGRLA